MQQAITKQQCHELQVIIIHPCHKKPPAIMAFAKGNLQNSIARELCKLLSNCKRSAGCCNNKCHSNITCILILSLTATCQATYPLQYHQHPGMCWKKNHSALVIVMEMKTVSINNLVEACITLEFRLWLVFGSDHNPDKLATFLQFTEAIYWIGLIDKFILTKKRSDSE